ncbi:MAG: hypothetical protein BWY06_03196 [Candidatus Latescibacteria bacterium ADurb.Bin168]|nr:MAG: hypothetical protein BWY06_03196 [Candidatus Latescibacteria bacterium ADurb.Bin168]
MMFARLLNVEKSTNPMFVHVRGSTRAEPTITVMPCIGTK